MDLLIIQCGLYYVDKRSGYLMGVYFLTVLSQFADVMELSV
jgi:hypothetical protein